MQIFLDMDGVLADFVGGALAIHGRDGYKVTNWNFFEEWGLTEDEFWEPINALGAEFWENLKPYPWAQDLVALVKSYDEDFVVLTKPSKDPGCKEGKKRWIDRYFPGVPVVFSQDKAKHCTGHKSILIDDSDVNCSDWWAAGGCALLFAQPWNMFGSLNLDPFEHVKSVLAERVECENEIEPTNEEIAVEARGSLAPAEGEMVVNEHGGKQSFVPARLDLIPPKNQLLLGECLGFGARKYGENNWQNITVAENLNHLLVHATKWLAGDRSEPHLVNILARGNFALWHAIESGEQPERYIHPDMEKAQP